MDLVDEQQRPLTDAPPLGGVFKCALQIGYAGEHRRQLYERQTGLRRQQSGDRGLADARRPPQDQRRQRAPRQHPRQRAFGAEQVILPHHIPQRRRPQPVGERAVSSGHGCHRRFRGTEQVISFWHDRDYNARLRALKQPSTAGPETANHTLCQLPGVALRISTFVVSAP